MQRESTSDNNSQRIKHCVFTAAGDGRCRCIYCGVPTRAKAKNGCDAFKRNCKQDRIGPGAFLTTILRGLGIVDDGKCGCKHFAALMDRKGPDWCEKNMPVILDRLRQNAQHLGVPFNTWIARALVRKAIRMARQASPVHVAVDVVLPASS